MILYNLLYLQFSVGRQNTSTLCFFVHEKRRERWLCGLYDLLLFSGFPVLLVSLYTLCFRCAKVHFQVCFEWIVVFLLAPVHFHSAHGVYFIVYLRVAYSVFIQLYFYAVSIPMYQHFDFQWRNRRREQSAPRNLPDITGRTALAFF